MTKAEWLKAAEAAGVTFKLEVEQEDLPLSGNVLASGDDAADRRAEEDVCRRLERGDVWAWACVFVTAQFHGFTGVVCLGCCSYASQADFEANNGEDLRTEALLDLYNTLRKATTAFAALPPKP